jgi:putative component of membrane protein insertase Oxa1/YidC/SpoIIIJ protein YidD
MGEVRQTPTCSSIACAAVRAGRAWVAEAETVMHIVACGMRLRGAAVIKTSYLWLLTDY